MTAEEHIDELCPICPYCGYEDTIFLKHIKAILTGYQRNSSLLNVPNADESITFHGAFHITLSQ